MGDPQLLQRAAEIAIFDTPALHALVADMQETMRPPTGQVLLRPRSVNRCGW